MNAILDALYSDMPATPDGSVQVEHFFGAGVYVRKSIVPAGKCVRMHVHNYDHIAIVGSGEGRLMVENEPVRAVKSGKVIEVKAGRKHAYLADTDTIWLCVHGTNEEEARRLYDGTH